MAATMVIERDVSITASDGLILRADIFRPQTSTRVPVVMVLGPYGKGVPYQTGYSSQWSWLFEKQRPDLLPGSTRSYMTWETCDPETWVPWGYACIRVDSRGTGRTDGHLDIFGPREVEDYYDAIEWAGTQPWSNGKVGLNGISYYAMNQWLVASLQPPHLTAMIPWEGAADFYRDYLRHGGIVSNNFFESWYKRQVISNQHGNADGWDDPWLGEKATGPIVLSKEELAQKRTNDLEEALKRPTINQDDWYLERTPKWNKVITPFLSAANWGGIGLHSRGNFEAFGRAASKQKWLEVHAGRHDEAFYLDNAIALQKRFLDHFLKGEENGWDKEPPVLLQIRRPGKPFGEFIKEPSWPLPDTNWTKWYLSSTSNNKTLSTTPSPSASFAKFNVTASEELLFTSPPLPSTTELTGPLSAHLYISSTTTNADLFLTLQAFSPTGEEVSFQGGWDPCTPLSQGWLRASHRKLDLTLSTAYRPYHSHDEIQPLTPGQICEVDVEIWPTHIILPEGYTVALRIGGQDFARGEMDGEAQLTGGGGGSGPFLHNCGEDRGGEEFQGETTIWCGGGYESFVLMPIIERT